ncbi:putative membrane protein [Escherichia coli DEC12C]|nr:putative membrane protein [Escherichia coli DEC12C]
MFLIILTPLVGVLGVLLLAYGAWLIYPPAGFVVAGVLCLCWSWLVARYLDRGHRVAFGGE